MVQLHRKNYTSCAGFSVCLNAKASSACIWNYRRMDNIIPSFWRCTTSEYDKCISSTTVPLPVSKLQSSLHYLNKSGGHAAGPEPGIELVRYSSLRYYYSDSCHLPAKRRHEYRNKNTIKFPDFGFRQQIWQIALHAFAVVYRYGEMWKQLATVVRHRER